jgi:AraC-like DNA-binding protein
VKLYLQQEVLNALTEVRARWAQEPGVLSIPPPRGLIREPRDRRIRQTLDTLAITPKVSVADLAAQAELSKSRLEHLFKREAGCTLRAFLCAHRLLCAAVLLLVTNLRIKEIAALTGYSCGQSLASAFLVHFDVNPCQYREEGRELIMPMAPPGWRAMISRAIEREGNAVSRW